MKSNFNKSHFMVIIVGAGPIGLAVAIALKKKDIPVKIIERGCLVNSIFNYPKNMTFFSSSEKLEIGNIPFISHGHRPTRTEALEYYRRAAEYYKLDIHLYEELQDISGNDGSFTVRTDKGSYSATKVVVATGFYDIARNMGIPGEELEKVVHYYDQAHKYAWQDIVVIGGGNSAVDVALETFRSHANVTLVIRQDSIKESVKYWVKPDIKNRIENGEIQAYFNSVVTEITPQTATIKTPEGTKTIPNDFVLAMTGYQPNIEMMQELRINITNDSKKMPVYNDDTLETNREGIYVAGVVCGGMDTSSLFIENTRIHAKHISDDIERKS